MEDNNGGMPLNIVGYAAKTEELKAKLLQSVAALFGEAAMGSGRVPHESRFAESCGLLLMLANRCGADMETLCREIKTQAKAGLANDDDFAPDHRAVLSFMDDDYGRRRL